jgi:hypothetical protein
LLEATPNGQFCTESLPYVYGPSPDCKQIFDGRSGLLLCMRLLGEAMVLLRAMMESAPNFLLITPSVSTATVWQHWLKAGRMDLFCHQ